MPKLRCRCDETIDLSPIPNPLGFMVMSEARSEELSEELIEVHRRGDGFEDVCYQKMQDSRGTVHAYECSKCGRWAILRRAGDSHVLLWLRPDLENTNEPSLRIAPIINLEHE